MFYHMLVETESGYHIAGRYKVWAGKPMMDWLLDHVEDNPGQRVWIVAASLQALANFSAIGMPSTYVWEASGWHERRMPVRPLVRD